MNVGTPGNNTSYYSTSSPRQFTSCGPDSSPDSHDSRQDIPLDNTGYEKSNTDDSQHSG